MGGVIRRDDGAALIVALMLMGLLAGIGSTLILIADLETAISTTHRTAHAVRSVAEAALDCGIADLAARSDWRDLAAAPGVAAACVDAGDAPRAPDGQPLDLPGTTREVQAETDSRYGTPPGAPESPRWFLAIAGRERFTGAEPGSPAAFVVIWVADDPEDGDGDPAADANGAVMIRAHAYGIRGARTALEALVVRSGAGAVRVVAWRRAAPS